MWIKALFIGMIMLSFTMFFSGCLDEGSKQKLEINLEVDSSQFPVKLIVESISSDKSYKWDNINISLTSQYISPTFIEKEGKICVDDIIEIPDSVFDKVSKIFVRIRLNTSSELLWDKTVYPPVTTPNITLEINQSKIIFKSVEKIDYDLNLDLTLENDTVIGTYTIFDKYEVIEEGYEIDLYEYEIYENVIVSLVYNPTDEAIGNFSLELEEPDPEIYLLDNEIAVDSMVVQTYFYILSGKDTIGSKVIYWDITADLPDWLTVTPMSGNFSFGSEKVIIGFSPEGIDVGEHTHTIKINSNYGNEQLDIILTKL